jgi:hypothetical protein
VQERDCRNAAKRHVLPPPAGATRHDSESKGSLASSVLPRVPERGRRTEAHMITGDLVDALLWLLVIGLSVELVCLAYVVIVLVWDTVRLIRGDSGAQMPA